jgi:F-type H+-transporting ATPase subunit b
MSTPVSNQAVVAVAPHTPHVACGGTHRAMMDVSPTLMLWTWVSFLIMTAILYKVAWKPILKTLDQREAKIRRALEDAAKARTAVAEAEANRNRLLAEATADARQVLDQARHAAGEAARVIEQRARAESQALGAHAHREIAAATVRAREALRRESADLAVAIAGKLLDANMDTERNKALAEKLIKEL